MAIISSQKCCCERHFHCKYCYSSLQCDCNWTKNVVETFVGLIMSECSAGFRPIEIGGEITEEIWQTLSGDYVWSQGAFVNWKYLGRFEDCINLIINHSIAGAMLYLKSFGFNWLWSIAWPQTAGNSSWRWRRLVKWGETLRKKWITRSFYNQFLWNKNYSIALVMLNLMFFEDNTIKLSVWPQISPKDLWAKMALALKDYIS